MGSAFHDGIDGLTTDLATACDAVRRHYADLPEGFDPYWWAIEQETVLSLVCGYEWRWREANLEVLATEQVFRVPLRNPATGAITPSFDLAGKIDGIVRLEDGRLAVKETKTCSEDLALDSDYWRRLRIDHQISMYVHAARELGHAVETVLYDVIRKPTIEANPVPLKDDQGVKIVLDARGDRVRTKDGKKWRETADTSLGYVLQTRPMATEEWSERLRSDIADRPDFYFARVEIPRLDQDIEEFRAELWDVQQAIREAQRTGRHYRTVTQNTCRYCPYFGICSTNQIVNLDYPPEGFEVLSSPHPELETEKIHGQYTAAGIDQADPAGSADACPSPAAEVVG
jgi:hypothetical protein